MDDATDEELDDLIRQSILAQLANPHIRPEERVHFERQLRWNEVDARLAGMVRRAIHGAREGRRWMFILPVMERLEFCALRDTWRLKRSGRHER